MLIYLLPAWVRKLPSKMAHLEKQTENILSQIDDINEGLDAIASDVAALEVELATLQANQPVDLSGPLAKVAAIRASLEAPAAPVAVPEVPAS
jgi:hypothetical protein